MLGLGSGLWGKKDYHNWSKEQLVHEIKQLLKRKKFGLVWEEKPEEVTEKCKEFFAST